MSLHDFALRKKQREELEMMKSVQDSLSGVDLPTSGGGGGGGGGGNGRQMDGKVDEEFSDKKAVMDGVVQLGPEKLELEKDLLDDGLRREVLCQGTSLSHWDDLLPFTEFQYNNHIHSATQNIPFLLDTGRLPRMGFEPGQPRSRLETVNEFKERMTDTLTEAKAALSKSKDDMAKYYDRRRTPAPDYQSGDRVYLDASDIHTTRPSQKLSHKRLGLFTIVKKVGNGAYRLRLPPSMSRLHPVFNVVKLTPAPEDPIQGRRPRPPPLPKIVNGEEEWIVEEILDSRMVNRKLRYLVKWEGFGIEHNSWEAWDDIHAPDLVADFHRKHSGAPRRIRFIDFNKMAFRLKPPQVVPGRHSLEGGVDVRGHPPNPVSIMKPDNHVSAPALTSIPTPYIPPHRRVHFKIPLLLYSPIVLLILLFVEVYSLQLTIAEALSYSFRTSC